MNSLEYDVVYQNTKRSLFSILVDEDDLITNQDALEEWMEVERLEAKMKTEKPNIKKITKMQEETFGKILDLC